MKDVAILGCGPAGLIAAHTVEHFGGQPFIYSKKQKSNIPGSQYLHEAIPGLTSVYPENTVQYVRMGTAEGYAQKVYGELDRFTGWDSYRALYPSWNVIRAYDVLWERYEQNIIEWPIRSQEDVAQVAQMHETTISTLPQPVLCGNDLHVFGGVPYWIKQLPTPEVDRGHDIVIYNGRLEDLWYRYSVLGDRCSIETTHMPTIDWSAEGWLMGTKATHNTCDCWPNIHRAGRWAEWRHGVLLHNVYHTVKEIMDGPQ